MTVTIERNNIGYIILQTLNGTWVFTMADLTPYTAEYLAECGVTMPTEGFASLDDALAAIPA
jgi:hypothetical protein